MIDGVVLFIAASATFGWIVVVAETTGVVRRSLERRARRQARGRAAQVRLSGALHASDALLGAS